MVAKTGRGILRTATSLSRSIAIAIVTIGSAARAQDAYPPVDYPPPVAQPPPAAYSPLVAQPPPPADQPVVAQPPPPAPPSVAAPVQPLRPPRPPGPNGFERRHRVGGQLGGTGIVQIVYRYRVEGPVHLEVGAAGMHGANLSAGAVVGAPFANRFSGTSEVEGLQIPQPAVDGPQVVERGSAAEVVALHQRNRQAALRRVVRDRQPVDAAADDEHVEGCVSESVELARAHAESSYSRGLV